MSNTKKNAAAQETCRKLIDAAGEVFAEKGLHAATIKNITDRAGVNVAAVNYHFKDKFELYAAVIRHALDMHPELPEDERFSGPPEVRLHKLISTIISDAHDPKRPAWSTTLLAHEFAQPTEALKAVIDEVMRPRSTVLKSIVRDMLGPEVSEQKVSMTMLSIASQFVLYLYNRELIERLHPALLLKQSRDQIVDHIVAFSLAGIKAMQ